MVPEKVHSVSLRSQVINPLHPSVGPLEGPFELRVRGLLSTSLVTTIRVSVLESPQVQGHPDNPRLPYKTP